jgi:AraC-like DNA-binding protein
MVVDILSETLKVVALKGAVFYNAEFSAPWSFRSPPSHVIAPRFGPDTGHVIMYHLLTEGVAWAALESGERVALGPGDIVIFPHGDPHLMGNGPAIEPVDNGKQLDRIFSQGLTVTRMGGGGAVTSFVCGYMVCEPDMSRLILAGLPPMLKINIRNDASGAWLENSIRFSVANAGSSDPGAEAVLSKLSEVLFMETLRRCVGELPPTGTGWLAGLRDSQIGNALGLLHRQPAYPWTISALAQAVGASRAVLAERFRHFLGEPPMSYLQRWRLQLAARLLTKTSQSVAEVAARVGYESEAAFNRAFKRMFSVPPARFRRGARPSMATTRGAAAAGGSSAD